MYRGDKTMMASASATPQSAALTFPSVLLLLLLVALDSSPAESTRVTTTTTTTTTTAEYPQQVTSTTNTTTTNTTTTTTKPRIVITTEGGHESSVVLPEDQPVSSLLVWSDAANTTVHLGVQSNYEYTRNFTLPQTEVWHLVNVYQPVSVPGHHNTPAMVQAPAANIYTSLNYSRVSALTFTSDHPAHWIFCPNAYTCALVPPPASTLVPIRSNRSEGGGERLLAPLLVVSLLLVVALIALMALTCYRRKDIFHVYEEPAWPPQPPPLPYPVLQVETVGGNSGRKLHQEEVTTTGSTTEKSDDVSKSTREMSISNATLPSPPTTVDVSHREPRRDWSRERDFTTIFPDQDSVNSLYGLILPHEQD